MQLRLLAREPDTIPLPVLGEGERARLAAYAERFNARDFDAVRDMLAEDVRLELVALVRRNGKKEVSTYFRNYGMVRDWHFVPGFADGRPAVLVLDPGDPAARAAYFVLLEWAGPELVSIRDFRHARYAAEDAELVTLD